MLPSFDELRISSILILSLSKDGNRLDSNDT